jgi:polysaccharide biosynthesis protein PslG
MKKVTLKLLAIGMLTMVTLCTPSIIYFIQRGSEVHYVAEGPINVDHPLGVAAGGIDSQNETKEIVEDLGISWGRMDLSWKDIENGTGHFNFTRYDWKIGNLTEMGVTVLGELDYDNDEVETDLVGNKTDDYIAPSDVPKYINYVNQTISHFYPNISYFEIWNEPNLPLHWAGPWEDYYYLFEQTVKFIKLHYLEVFLVAPAISDLGHVFLKQLFERGHLQQCDAISFHTYHQYSEALINRVWQLRDLCNLYNYSGEFWLTEFGYPTGGTYIHVIDEKDQGDRLIKVISLSLAMGIDKVFWYTFKDGDHDDPLNSESYFGLLYNDYSFKTGAFAYKFFSEYCVNSTLRTDLTTISGFPPKKNIYGFFYQQENLTSTLILWFKSPLTMREKIKVRLELPAIPSTVISHGLDNTTQIFSQDVVKLGYNSLVLTFIAVDPSSSVRIYVRPSGLKLFAYLLMGIGIAFPLTILVLKRYKDEILEKINLNLQEKN